MIFEVSNGSIHQVRNAWNPGELELENYIIRDPGEGSNARIFDATIFGEPLLMLENQVTTKQQKRADIVALDQSGNGVFIELKKREARQGVETQALQYLANFSSLKGERFLQRFRHSKDEINDFLGDFNVHNLNARSRIILLAHSFDDTIFSLGEWLAAQGVAFRCIEYTPFRVGKQNYLSFSVRFDRSKEPLYHLTGNSRDTQCFWHNIGTPPIKSKNDEVSDLDAWWHHHCDKGILTAGFNDEPGDAGDRILNSYVPNDIVVAYVSGYGAVGWGIVKAPQYTLVDRNHDRFSVEGTHLHRLKGIEWKLVANSVVEAVSAKDLKDRFKLSHPIQTKSRIRRESAEALRSEMASRFRPPNKSR